MDNGTPETPSPAAPADDARPSIGQLFAQLSDQLTALVRAEIELAKAELTAKATKAGIGIGLFAVAGMVAFFLVATLVAAAVLGLATVMPGWAAALVVAGVLLLKVVVLVLVGRASLQRGVPPTPERAMDNVKADVAAIKEELAR